MNRKSSDKYTLMRKLRYALNYLPLRPNFWLLALISAVALYWAKDFSSLAGDSARVQYLLSYIAVTFSLVVFTFSLVTVAVPYLGLLFRRHVVKTLAAPFVHVQFAEGQLSNGRTATEVQVDRIGKPVFGSVKLRLLFDDYSQADDLLLTDRIKTNEGYRARIARQSIDLPNIRDYRIQASLLLFEDFFHLFSLPYREREQIDFYTAPAAQPKREIDVSTNSTEDPVQKVLQHKTARGELLDYKKFAPGDDIRRILWKNYARVRELTVRVHDRTFPYVSTINLLVSFHDGTPDGRDGQFKQMLLDIYKEKLRQVVDSIIDQEFNIRLVSDQGLRVVEGHDAYPLILKTISTAKWQRSVSAAQFVQQYRHTLRQGSNLFIFSSLCPADHIDQLERQLAEMNVVYYNMHRTLDQSKPPHLLKRLFLVNTLEGLELARRKLEARGAVKFLLHNSGRIDKILAQHQQTVIEV